MVYSAWHDLWENVPPGSYIVCWQSQGIALNMFSRHIYIRVAHHVQALAIGVCTGGAFSQCELEHAGANLKRISAEGWGGIDMSTVVHGHEGLLLCMQWASANRYRTIVECGSGQLKHCIFNLHLPFLPIVTNPYTLLSAWLWNCWWGRMSTSWT